MKTALVVIFLALVVVASSQENEAGQAKGGKWTQEELLENLKGKYGDGVCINVSCRKSCIADGHAHGYCALNTCNCVVKTPVV